MSEKDTDEIMEIWLSENMLVHSFMSNDLIMKNKERTEQLIKKSKVFVCEKDNEILGFISLSGNYIDCLYVKSKSQRQGIGKALMKHCKNIFWSLMIKVYQQNENAVSFFEKQSFFVRDKMDNAETGETELFMEWIR
ncbi:MAG: GNAT family N-acetyltransferase [Candidatus Gastranaerophilales bacterium]|nr:GNAT family N-acetyltransferase [Candidatus Gastranaerophilales bacterium]